MDNSDEYIPLSGIQHYSFCRRQWALIHIEQQWEDNLLTAEGIIKHQRVHNSQTDYRTGVITVRNMPIKSDVLRVSGYCDAVEFSHSSEGVTLLGHSGNWSPCPVEYKRGRRKQGDSDRLQVAAQAMCLEEMFSCEVKTAGVFYYETREKEVFEISDELKKSVNLLFREMHQMLRRGHTPSVKMTKACKNCSLFGVCLPFLQEAKDKNSVETYISSFLREGDLG